MARSLDLLSLSDPVESPLFGVDCSLRGQKWLLRSAPLERVGVLVKNHDLSWPVARLLAARGIDAGDVPGFLQPRLRDSLPNPSHLPDMDKATSCLVEAIHSGDPVGLFGDYDVDGQSSLALFHEYLNEIGVHNLWYVPHRLQEGYGPNQVGFDYLASHGTRLIVTVDCGATAHEALHYAASRGLRVIIVDHHRTDDTLPPAYAHINPNRHDHAGPGKDLAAVGVVFLLLIALNRELRLASYFSSTKPEPDMLSKLDLVALGTVADMVPLQGLNRAFVSQGLKVITKGKRPGLAVLANLAKLNKPLRASDIAFRLAPRLNAAGRIGHAQTGVHLLTARNIREAQDRSLLLEKLNIRRRILDKSIFNDADKHVSYCLGQADRKLLLAADEGWHLGVLGIVASRLVKLYHRPAIVLNLDGAFGKGSGRAPEGLDLGAAVFAARAAGLIEAGGGHKAAVGLTVCRSNLDQLHIFLENHISHQIDKIPSHPILIADAVVAPGALNEGLICSLDAIEPFGVGHPKARFALTKTFSRRAHMIEGGQSCHIRCRLEAEDGAGIEAIAFNVNANDPLGRCLLGNDGRPLHIMGELLASNSAGQASFVIEDIA